MSTDNRERERLPRLRDAQITSRDPGQSKIPGYDWQQHARRGQQLKTKHKAEQKPLLIDLFLLLPKRWQGAVIGTLVGAIPAIAGYLLLSEDMALLAVVPLILLGVIGYVSGCVIEPEKSDWD
jgi:hypothetical protein